MGSFELLLERDRFHNFASFRSKVLLVTVFVLLHISISCSSVFESRRQLGVNRTLSNICTFHRRNLPTSKTTAYVTYIGKLINIREAAVLACSLKKHWEVQREMVALIPPAMDSEEARKVLTFWGWRIHVVEVLKLPRHRGTISKIEVWKLTEFEKVVFIDQDTLILQPIEELFALPELSASLAYNFFTSKDKSSLLVPNSALDPAINSGVCVIVPSKTTYKLLHERLFTKGSFNHGDQGLYNEFFAGKPRWQE